MAYYQIAPSAGYNPSNQLNPDSNYEHQDPLMNPSGGFRYRSVTPQETVQNQLGGLMNSNNFYLRNARAKGAAYAAAHGIGNSTLAAGNAEGAAINAALPIAQQDASTYFQTHKDNMDAENQALLAQLQANTQLQGASIGASASMYGADRGLDADKLRIAAAADQAAQDRQFQQQMAGQQHGWNVDTLNMQHGFQTQDAAQQNLWNQQQQQQGYRNNIGQTIAQTILGNPEIWRDPQGAAGFATNYNNLFTSLVDQLGL
jgi:hypothetical protein